jgi:cardiolipin synthase (CMP-forming)
MLDAPRKSAEPSSRPGRPVLVPGLISLADAITLGRLGAVPLAVWLVLRHHLAITFWLFVAAGVSDAVDGWLARRNGGNGSALGRVIDPVADKALLVTMFLTLSAISVLPDWLAILVVFRDVLIVGGVLVLFVLGQPVAIRPLYISKLNTALQIVLVATALLLAGSGRLDLLAAPWLSVLIWTVAATTTASGAAYVWNAARTR